MAKGPNKNWLVQLSYSAGAFRFLKFCFLFIAYKIKSAMNLYRIGFHKKRDGTCLILPEGRRKPEKRKRASPSLLTKIRENGL